MTRPPKLTGDDLLGELERLLEAAADEVPEPAAPGAPTWDPASDDSMLDWAASELGLRLREVPAVQAAFLEAIHAFRERRMLRLALLGPRGGGKTMLDAAIEVAAWRWYGGDWTNIAGSEKQAQECYGYIGRWIRSSDDLRRHTFSTLRSLTTSRAGGRIIVCAASERSVRGPHPRGPSGLGGVTVDEEALVERNVFLAGTDQLSAANPSGIVRSGTLGPATGTWWELLQDPKKQGYSLHRWTAFDVARRCPYDCTKDGSREPGGCPVYEHFAKPHHLRVGDRQEFVHDAYCGGRAHEVDGWISIDYLAQRWKEVDRETFEREYLGRGAADRAGKVYDPQLLDAAVLHEDLTFSHAGDQDEHERRFRQLEKKVGLDWGYAGQTAICYAVRVRDVVVVYRWATHTQQRFSLIRQECLAACQADGVTEIWPDAANPSDNAELAVKADELSAATDGRTDLIVSPVVFSRDKAYGIGEVRRRLEQGKLKFATSLGGRPVPGWERALAYLKGYAQDENGQPVKKDDHVPDALLCACVGFSENRAPVPVKR